MGLMTFLRNRAGIIIVVLIGVAIVAFLVADAVHYGSGFMRSGGNDVGEIAGKSVSYEDYNAQIEQTTNAYRQQSGQNTLNDQMNSMIQEQTWNQFISRTIIDKEVAKIGLSVGEYEVGDLIKGKEPAQQIVQAFTNPQTGQFDRKQLDQTLQMINSNQATPQMKKEWGAFIRPIIQARLAQKYVGLIQNGLYVNSLDVKDDYENRSKLAAFTYVNLDYASVPDKDVKPADADYKEYYEENKARFKNDQEQRSFKYVTFDASPSKSDSAQAREQAAKLAADFKTSTNDSLFAAVNSDTKEPMAYRKKGQLGPALDSIMFTKEKGFIYGPYFENGAYKVAKVEDVRVGPDSVKARHILINPAQVGGNDKALAKADSIKKLVQGGKDFAELAKTFSTDQGSAAKGGELGGFFPRGSMVPEFEDAAFNGKKGDLEVVTSQFGVHLIQILDQKGSSKVVKLAIVDKNLQASDATRSAAYGKAQSFLSAAANGAFNETAKKQGLRVQDADGQNGSSIVFGLDNSRQLIKWAFDAGKGDVSNQVFDCGSKYAVAYLTGISPAGFLPLESVKKEIEPAVRNRVKGKQLAAKVEDALKGASNINQVAQKLKRQPMPVQNVVFANPIIPGVAQENKVVGSVFGSQPGKLSKAVIGENGVYAFAVQSFSKPAPLTNALRQRQQIDQVLMQRSSGEIFQALKDKANVKDNRVKFY
ncbi:MAG: SurA N-terminal domain-containing protein [Mucilaginibacter polytrichastri]|nr:SurA N-terminal domain-containing protein [Mucilaginibacter polytrichastri]